MKHLLLILLVGCNTFSSQHTTNKPFVSLVSDSTPHLYNGLIAGRITYYRVMIRDSIGECGTLTADGQLTVYDSARLIKCLIKEFTKRSKPVVIIIGEDTMHLWKGDTIRGWFRPSDNDDGIAHQLNYQQ